MERWAKVNGYKWHEVSDLGHFRTLDASDTVPEMENRRYKENAVALSTVSDEQRVIGRNPENRPKSKKTNRPSPRRQIVCHRIF